MRFIGCKKLLINDIEDVIEDNVQGAEILADIFSGTATVARHFKEKYTIISNDLMYFSYVLQRGTIELDSLPKFKKLKNIGIDDPFDYLENHSIDMTDLKDFFIFNNYSPTEINDRKYFNNKNAIRIDFIRKMLLEWCFDDLLNEDEYFFILASLIESVPYISNISGTYGAYLKHWDKRALNKLKLLQPKVCINGKNNKCYNQNANDLVEKIQGDILYIDPPYNSRQYLPNYHILETISLYDYPNPRGVTGLRSYADKLSQYCRKAEALKVLDELIAKAQFKHIIISYSNEGIISEMDLSNVLKRHSHKKSFKKYQIPYRRYKGKLSAKSHNLHELLYYIEK